MSTLIIDASERRVQRLKDAQLQREFYSGKKKTHTVKNTFIIDTERFIHFLGLTTQGKVHDLHLLELDLPLDEYLFQCFEILVDLGYIGIDKIYEIKELVIPIKKTRKAKGQPKDKLTDEQKAFNTSVSKRRVIVEHAIGSVKKFDILKDVFRAHLDFFDNIVIQICAAIHNLSIKY